MAKQTKVVNITKRGRMSALDKELKMSQAKSLFVKGFSIQSISEITGVGAKTLASWRDNNNWEEEKDLASLTPTSIRNLTLKCAVAIQEGKPLPYSADQISKIVSAFEKISDTRKIAVYTMEALNNFSNYMVEKAAKQKGATREEILDFSQESRVHFDGFITELLQND